MRASSCHQSSVYTGGEVALKGACAAASWPGWRRRGTRRKPSRRRTVLMLCSASTTPNLVLIARERSAGRQRTTPCSARLGPRQTHVATTASCSGESRGLGPKSPWRSVSPAKPLPVVAVHPVAQCLPVHSCCLRGLGARYTLHHEHRSKHTCAGSGSPRSHVRRVLVLPFKRLRDGHSVRGRASL